MPGPQFRTRPRDGIASYKRDPCQSACSMITVVGTARFRSSLIFAVMHGTQGFRILGDGPRGKLLHTG